MARGRKLTPFERDITSAKEKSTDASNKAAAAESHLAEALREATSAQAELNRIKAPRSLVNIDQIIADLKPFAGTEYDLRISIDGGESIDFAKIIAFVLDKAGWTRTHLKTVPVNFTSVAVSLGNGPAEPLYLTCPSTGIYVTAHLKDPLAFANKPIESATTSLKAMVVFEETMRKGISPSDPNNIPPIWGIDPAPGESPLTICVGKKP